MIAESGGRRDITEPEGTSPVKTKLRTTINPWTVIEVDEPELVDLHRLGLIHSHELKAADARELGIEKSGERWRDGEPEVTPSGVIEFGKPEDDNEGGAE